MRNNGESGDEDEENNFGKNFGKCLKYTILYSAIDYRGGLGARNVHLARISSRASNSSDWFRSLAVVRWLGGGAANNDNDARNDNRVGGFRGFHGSPRALIAGTARFYRRDTARRTRALGRSQAFLHAEMQPPLFASIWMPGVSPLSNPPEPNFMCNRTAALFLFLVLIFLLNLIRLLAMIFPGKLTLF